MALSTLGVSSEPNVEAEVLSDVATYGKQLERIGDALIVLIDHLPREALTPSEAEAVDELKLMLKEIQKIKVRHHRPAFGPKKDPSVPNS
jgi:hypothetical protein